MVSNKTLITTQSGESGLPVLISRAVCHIPEGIIGQKHAGSIEPSDTNCYSRAPQAFWGSQEHKQSTNENQEPPTQTFQGILRGYAIFSKHLKLFFFFLKEETVQVNDIIQYKLCCKQISGI